MKISIGSIVLPLATPKNRYVIVTRSMSGDGDEYNEEESYFDTEQELCKYLKLLQYIYKELDFSDSKDSLEESVEEKAEELSIKGSWDWVYDHIGSDIFTQGEMMRQPQSSEVFYYDADGQKHVVTATDDDGNIIWFR